MTHHVPAVVQVWRAVDFCCQYLEQEVSEDNYLYLQELALFYSLERLDTFIDRFVLQRFATLSFTRDFLLNIPLHKLSSYLASSQVTAGRCWELHTLCWWRREVARGASIINLGAPPLLHHQVQHDSEQALLQAAMQWLSQTPERTAHSAQLLSHIRFPLMPAADLVTRVLAAVRSLLPGEAGCEALVEEAREYHANPSAQPLLQTGRTALRGGAEQLLLIGGEVQCFQVVCPRPPVNKISHKHLEGIELQTLSKRELIELGQRSLRPVSSLNQLFSHKLSLVFKLVRFFSSLLLKVSEFGEELSANVCRLAGETEKWEVETELPGQRSHHCLAVLGGFIFAAGGSSSRDNGGDAACNLLYRYDPRHNQWTRVLHQTNAHQLLIPAAD